MSGIIRPEIDIDARRFQIQNLIDELFDRLQLSELYTDTETKRDVRNVLLMGPSKSGKTTLTRVLHDPRYISEELSLRSSSDTQASCIRDITPIEVPVMINIIELPDKIISTKDSVSMIHEECRRFDIHHFHLIALCVSFDAGIDGSAIQSFEHLIDYFREEPIRRNLCLIITRCESKNEDQRTRLHNEVRHDVQFNQISEYFERGIHFSGALNRDNWNGASEALYNQFETVYEYRKNLLELIAEDVRPFHIPPPLPPPPQSDTNSVISQPRYIVYSKG